MSSTTSFNMELLLDEEYKYYGEKINAVGLLEVTDNTTGNILTEQDGTPWFLIEHATKVKYFLDDGDDYFDINDDRYSYKWIAKRT